VDLDYRWPGRRGADANDRHDEGTSAGDGGRVRSASVGIRDVDPALFAEIRAADDSAMAAGKSNYGECFAGNVTVDTPEAFAAYDPVFDALIGRVFTRHHLAMDVFHGKRIRPVECPSGAPSR
jgi:hypothetical protein